MKSAIVTAVDNDFVSTSPQESVNPPATQPTLTLTYPDKLFCHATITIPQATVNVLYHQAAITQQHTIQTYGFTRGEVPLDYIKHNFKENLIEHIKEFLLKQMVIAFLYQQIRTKKIAVAGSARLINIEVELDRDAEFIFELTQAPIIAIENWKYFPFKAPKRKNYKDLDRQVDSFLAYEKEQLAKHNQENGLQLGDWVSFDLCIVDQENRILPEQLPQHFWFKLSSQDGEGTLRENFLNKKAAETFFTDNGSLQEFFSTELETNYTFRISIFDVIPHTYFCIEQFKAHFRLKTNKEVHQKLIEVFSFRNDVCLRRAMVEETLKLLTAKNPFTVPTHLIARQEEIILEKVQESPDYNVYRTQKDFHARIKELAERQTREEILLDQLAYHENLAVSDNEVKNYLSFFNRPRMKEFIYCEFPSHKVQGQEVPIPTEFVKNYCLREKMVNHLIYYLTKK